MSGRDSAAATLLDPAWLDRAAYIDFLNRGFPGHWDRAAFDWYVARDFNGRRSELLVRASGTRILAGVSLCHRQVRIGQGPPIDVCVASAGATLPSERGRGHYARLLESALERCRHWRCAALLGFVTADNGSGRGLKRIGARAIPSFYIASAEAARGVRPTRLHAARLHAAPVHAARAVARGRRLARALAGDRFAARAAALAPPDGATAAFHYEHHEDWALQFLERPNPVRAVRLAHDALALIETVGHTDRLQWLAGPDHKTAAHIAMLAAASARAGRRFFMYTLDPRAAHAARRAGLAIRDGLLMIQPTGTGGAEFEALAAARWCVQSGDRL